MLGSPGRRSLTKFIGAESGEGTRHSASISSELSAPSSLLLQTSSTALGTDRLRNSLQASSPGFSVRQDSSCEPSGDSPRRSSPWKQVSSSCLLPETVLRRCWESRERTQQMIIQYSNQRLLSDAVHHLGLGRCALGLALAAGGDVDGAGSIDAAVEGLRAAGTEHHLPWGLIARANLHRFCRNLVAAEADLAEALEISERGSMRLHECDAHLEWARLCRSAGDLDGARKHLLVARDLVASTGYHRRDREVEELTQALEDEG